MMDKDPVASLRAIKYLSENYYDPQVNNNKTMGANESSIMLIKENYRFLSMKQSVFKNIKFESTTFENVALTGSFFDNVTFYNSNLAGSSFANCDFYHTKIYGDYKEFPANNFSQSNFEECELKDTTILNTGILSALFHNCNFEKITIKGSTIEGTKFVGCHFNNCDFSRVNLDYTFFNRSSFSDTTFPFYQLPYIIGFADFINDETQVVSIRVGEKIIFPKEYREQFDNLIYYFLDKDEYFPACNLCVAKQDFDSAKLFLIDGITKAITTRNFRVISYFCQLGRQHGILNDEIKHKINKAMDEFIRSDGVPESQLNFYLIYIGKIKNILNEGSANSITLNYTINTNISKKNEEGVAFINDMVNDLNVSISSMEGVEGFQISVSNHSPFEIVVQVIGLISNIATIAGSVWKIITSLKNKKEQTKTVRVDNDTYIKYIDARVDQLKEELLRLNKQYNQKTLGKHIKSVTQSLKTDLEELYSKDIMIFKVESKPQP